MRFAVASIALFSSVGVVASAQNITGRNWCDTPAYYYFTPRLPVEFRSPTEAAASDWNAVPSWFDLFSEGVAPSGPTAFNCDGYSVVDYFDFPDSDVGAATQCCTRGTTITECDFAYSSRTDWSVFDRATVARHEFGHWLELDHTNAPADVMYGYIDAGEIKYLSDADKAGIQQIYPLETGPENCGSDGGGGGGGGGWSGGACLVYESQGSIDDPADDPEDQEYGPHQPWNDPACFPMCRFTGLGTALAHFFRGFVLLRTAEGRKYVAMFERHNDEVAAIFRAHPDIAREAGSLMNDFMPGLRYYLFADPEGENFVLDAARLAAVQRLADRVAALGTAALRKDLARFSGRLAGEQGKTIADAIGSMLEDRTPDAAGLREPAAR